MKKEEFGVENVKGITGFLGRTITAVVHIDQDQDGVVSRMEKFGLAQTVGFDAFNVLGRADYKALGEESKDLDATEIMELVANYSENQQLKDPVLEGIIEDSLLWAAGGANLFERLKDWKTLKSQTTEFKTIGEIAPNLLPAIR